jgi:hypothetical protein
MAKKIKITERQLRLIEEQMRTLNSSKKIKITESQYERLFKNNKKQLEEDGSIAVEFLTFASEAIGFLKELMTDPSQAGLSPFWVKLGVTRGELFSTMADLGIIAGAAYGGVEGTKKVFKVKKRGLIKALKRIYNEFAEKPRYDNKTGEILPDQKDEAVFMGDDMEIMEDNFPTGAQDDPNAPYNQPDPEYPTSDSESFRVLKEVFDGENHTLLFLTDGMDEFVVIYSDKSTQFEEFCGSHVDTQCVMNMINSLEERGHLEIGECGYDCGSHYIHDLDENMKSYIMEYHATKEEARAEIMSIFSVEETTSTGGVGGSYEAPFGSQGPIHKGRNPSDELNEEDIDETTMSGDATGSYEQPKIWAKDKANWRHAKDPMYKDGKIVAEGEGMGSQKRYAFEFKGDGYIYAKNDRQAKRIAKKLQEFFAVENENVEDIDVTTTKLVEVPFGVASMEPRELDLNETREQRRLMREALKLQRDSKKKKIAVVSDLEGRAAGRETFRNKNALHKAGFRWSGSHWEIDEDKFEVAKETLTTLNKAEYLIDSLEDLEEKVEGAKKMDKKSLVTSKLEQYIDDLANATDAATLGSEIRRYLTFFSKFHNYSFHNRILIYIQRPDATRVASFKKWKDLNRQVKKGSKSITVLAPIFDKSNNKDGEENLENGNEDDKRVKGFIGVNVFDISDTVPIDESGEIPEEPKWYGDNEPSEVADELYGQLVSVAEDLNIKVTQSQSQRGEKGYSAGDHINLSSEVEGVGKISTLVHEMAHELMHWRGKSIYYAGDDVKQDRALKELQAESVSYVVLKHFDLPVKHHPTYLALWNANSQKIKDNLELISKVAQFIIGRVEAVSKSSTVVSDGVIDKIMTEMVNRLNQ